MLLTLLPAPLPSACLAEIRRLPSDVRPTAQDVFLKLDPSLAEFSGSVKIDLDVRVSVSSFQFHAPTALIGSVVLRDREGVVPASVGPPDEQGIVTLTAERPLLVGAAVLGVAFGNVFNEQLVGLYRTESRGEWYAFTQMEPDDCRRAFPCWDEPEYKIPFTMTVEVPEGQTAVSNGPEISRETKDGWTKFRFGKMPPMPTYLVAVAAGKLESVPVPGTSIPTRIVVPAGQAGLTGTAVEMTPPILAAMEQWFDRPYPYEKLDLIAVPDFWPGAMENPGAITFADRALLVDPADGNLQRRKSLAMLVAHEIAHIWYGDFVTMKWWDDLWLNETFADWMGDKIVDQLWPEYAVHLTEQSDVHALMRSDARPGARAIRQPVESSHDLLGNVGTAYNKGKRVLGNVEQWLGPDIFRQGVLDYLERNAWGSAESADLWAALGRASGRDVSGALTGFLDQTGYPLLRIEPQPRGKVEVSQVRYTVAGQQPDKATWSVPVGLRFSDGKQVREKTFLLSGRQEIFALDMATIPAWVFPNVDGWGYYRWLLPPAQLLTMVDSAQVRLTPAERIETAANLTALLDAGMINAATWLDLEKRLAGDPEPVVVAAVARNVEAIGRLLVTPEVEESYAAYLRGAFGPTLDRIGLEPRPGEPATTGFIRPEIYLLLGRDGADPRVVAAAQKRVRDYLDTPGAPMDALTAPAFQVAGTHGDRKLFDECLARFRVAAMPAERQLFLSTLGSFRDPKLAEAALELILANEVRPGELRTLVTPLTQSEAGKDRVFAWIQENYEELVPRLPGVSLPFLPGWVAGCSAERTAAMEAFFGRPDRSVPGTAGELGQALDEGRDCRGLREREGAIAAQYLRRL